MVKKITLFILLIILPLAAGSHIGSPGVTLKERRALMK